MGDGDSGLDKRAGQAAGQQGNNAMEEVLGAWSKFDKFSNNTTDTPNSPNAFDAALLDPVTHHAMLKDSSGNAQLSVTDFQIQGGAYNPVRPPGIGEMKPGEANSSYTKKGNPPERTSQLDTELGQTTYNYTGDLNNGTFIDTKFTAQESFDQNGRLTHTDVKYTNEPVDITFMGKDGNPVTIKGVKEVESSLSNRQSFGEYYYTRITCADGTEHELWTNALSGRVSNISPEVEAVLPRENK